MGVLARQCPACATPLAEGAVFCHMCGAATPHEIDAATGEYRDLGTTDRLVRDLSKFRKALGDHYEIGDLIGRGGFAEVYHVRDLRLKRELALKAIRPDLVLSDILLTRFRREAETIAALRHPHIVSIYDVGEVDGTAYILMPLIKGESLKSLLAREGPRPFREAIRILLEAADALGAAHEAGVIHRDVKPENIMLEGKSRRVQLMDFGISKAIDASGDKNLTSTGMLVGTPHYMSPEQASGDPHIDSRSDQYSLAVVGYQMVTGSLPFDGDSTRAILFQQMVALPKSLRELAPTAPAYLSAAIERAMAKEPKDRFESMEVFADAVSQHEPLAFARTSGESGTMPSLPKIEAPRAPAKRRWIGVAVAVAVVAGAVWFSMTRFGGKTPAVVPLSAPPVASDLKPASSQPEPPPPSTQQPAQPPAPPSATATTVPTEPVSCATAQKKSDWPAAVKACSDEAEKGSVASALVLAGLYERGQGVPASDSLAAVWYRAAAAKGNGRAEYRLALMYIKGTGVPQNEDSGTALLRRASEHGSEESWATLADRYSQGLGTKRNDAEALFYYRKAAERGDVIAELNLGQMYQQGRGVDKDEAEAARWFAKASERGNATAQYHLGMLYLRGKGVPKDEAQGLRYLEAAAAKGYPDAIKEVAKRKRS